LKTERIPLSKLFPAERNVRAHPKEQIEHLVRSIRMFGQFRNIVVDEDNIILAGNGLYAALKEAGITHAYCFRKTGLTDNQKKKLMIVDNKTFTLGMDITGIQFDLIREINDTDIPGFDEDVLSALLAGVEAIDDRLSEFGMMSDRSVEERRNAAPVDAGSVSSPDSNDGKRIRCPHCGKEIWMP